MYCWVFSTEIYQQLSLSIKVQSSGSLPKRLNLCHIVGVLEIIYASVCSLELYSNMFLWAVLLDSTNEGQVFTDKPFCNDQ